MWIKWQCINEKIHTQTAHYCNICFHFEKYVTVIINIASLFRWCTICNVRQLAPLIYSKTKELWFKILFTIRKFNFCAIKTCIFYWHYFWCRLQHVRHCRPIVFYPSTRITTMFLFIAVLGLAAFFFSRSSKELPKNWSQLKAEISWQYVGIRGLIEDYWLRKHNHDGKHSSSIACSIIAWSEYHLYDQNITSLDSVFKSFAFTIAAFSFQKHIITCRNNRSTRSYGSDYWW